MSDFVPARIVVKLYGVEASLTHHGISSGDNQYWECDDWGIKKILDSETSWCINAEYVLDSPFFAVLDDWAIRAGTLVAQRLGAEVISVRPMKPPSKPGKLPPGTII